MALAPTHAEALVDLDRYPIVDLALPAARQVVEHCRAQLAADGACELPGFLHRDAVERAACEAVMLSARAHRSRVDGTVYLGLPDESAPEAHPRRVVGANALAAVAYDRFPHDSTIRALYEWTALRSFVAAVLGVAHLFPYADPLGALNLAVMTAGDELAWHFDQTDFVVSLALVTADRGGDFEYVPNLRTATDERYDAVAAVLDGVGAGVTRLSMTPGTLLLFEGRHALHRVTPVEGPTARLVALLAYDTKPGTTSSQLLRLVRYGRDAPDA